jgi:hypothetical protein
MSEQPTDPITKVRLATLFYQQVETILCKKEPTAAEMEFCRKVMESNSITLGTVERGDFGDLGKAVAARNYPDFDSPEFVGYPQ